MTSGVLRVVGMIVGLGLVLGTGYGLSRAGRPYGALLLNAHKLVGLAMLVFIVWRSIALHRAAALASGLWIVASLAALALVVLLGTGGVLSAAASPPAVVRWLHKVVPYVAVVLSGVWIYLVR